MSCCDIIHLDPLRYMLIPNSFIVIYHLIKAIVEWAQEPSKSNQAMRRIFSAFYLLMAPILQPKAQLRRVCSCPTVINPPNRWRVQNSLPSPTRTSIQIHVTVRPTQPVLGGVMVISRRTLMILYRYVIFGFSFLSFHDYPKISVLT